MGRRGATCIGSPAFGPTAKVGIRKDDVIRNVNGRDIWNEGFERQLLKKKPGQVVKIELERGAQTRTVTLTLRPESEPRD